MQPSGTVKVLGPPPKDLALGLCRLLGGLALHGSIRDLSLLKWHMRLGALMVGLLLFRLLWGLWGGIHARWRGYMPSPAPIRGPLSRWACGRSAHRAGPGAGHRLRCVGGGSGRNGPVRQRRHLHRRAAVRAPSATRSPTASRGVHNRAFMAIIGLIAVHLTAHVVYALKRDPTPLAMFTGRKRTAVEPTGNYWLRAAVTAAIAATAVLAGGLMP